MEFKRKFREPDDATRKKMSIKKMGILNPNFGKQRDNETKQLISKKMKKYWETVPSKNNCNNINKQ